MKKIILAAVLAANIGPSFAGQAEPSTGGGVDEIVEVLLSQPDPEILCRNDHWTCFARVKNLKMSCRVEDVTPENKSTILKKMGIEEARKRYAEKSPTPGKYFFRSKNTDAPRMVYLLNDKTAVGCVLEGDAEFINAVLEGAKK